MTGRDQIFRTGVLEGLNESTKEEPEIPRRGGVDLARVDLLTPGS